MKLSKPTGPPIVRIGGVQYYLDMRLKRLRGVHDPEDVVELDEELAGVEE